MPEKSQTEYLFKGEDKDHTLIVVLLLHCHKKHLNYKNIIRNILQIEFKSCLALYKSYFLMLL